MRLCLQRAVQSETENPDGQKISTVSMTVISNATDETSAIDSPSSAELAQPASGNIATSEAVPKHTV